jgi:hypothetical protein
MTSRQDDPTIAGEIRLWRRIPPWTERVTWDTDTGEPESSSLNFRDEHNELSMYIASEISVDYVLRGHEGFGLVELTAGEIRRLVPGVIICRDPDPHPSHVLICAKITKAPARGLRNLCRWVVKPQGPVDA